MREKTIDLARRLVLVARKGHLVKFLFVGVASFAIDLGLLALLHEVAQVDLWVATPIAFLASLAFNFFVQRSFTFQSSSSTHVSFAKYGALVVFNVVATDLIVNIFAHWGMAYPIAKVFATVATTVWNFLLYKYWIFPSHRAMPAEDSVVAMSGLPPAGSNRN